MANDSTNDELQDRGRDESNESRERPPGREPGDTARERIAWGLFIVLSGYISLHPFLPEFSPDPAIVGTLTTGLVSLLAARALSGLGGRA